MKRLLILVAILLASCSLASAQQSRNITNFDKDWEFSLGEEKKSWRKLDLPHDWSIEGENLESNPGAGKVGYFPSGTGWYRKTFDVKGYSRDKLYSIEFDGIYMNSTVWVNGTCLGTWPYGYSSFSYDLTPVLKAKGNVITVHVDNSKQPNSRWYTGSGIYRHVRLVATDKTHFKKWGVFHYTKSLVEGTATVKVESEIVNKAKSQLNAIVRQTIIDKEGNEVASSDSVVSLIAGDQLKLNQELSVADAKLWDTENPYLYTLRSQIIVAGKEKDKVESSLGIRTIEYDIDKGFLLNGKQVKMKGVNLHHDGGAVGAAVPERVWERRIEILKSGGCNAIRTAHNPPAPEFLDLCDKHGMLVMDEAFDQWAAGKNQFDYHIDFDRWHERDLYAMVARDRNHASVVMWSIGNEIPDQSTAVGPELAREMIAYCHILDPTRLVTCGNDNIASNTPATEEYLAEFEDDIVGYNYPDRWRTRRELMYAIDKAAHPERRVVATESSGFGGARRQYFFPDRRQQSPQAQQARRRISRGIISSNLIDVEERWRFTMSYDYVIGDFMWTGIDYYGESRWPSRGATSGYLDNCGFKKDGYWFFKSIWSDEPVLHLLPHWNWEGREGDILQVACFTNCEEVELFVNGKSYGTKSTEYPRKGVELSWSQYGPGKNFATTSDLHLVWDVEYQPGEIKAVGIKNGERFEQIIRTAGAPAQIRASVDRESFKADPTDVAHITVEVLDAEGNICPLADNLIKFSVKGAELIGVESGNMQDLSSVLASERKAYSGMCLGIVAAEKPGTVTVTVESEGLTPATITFKAE
ncbi:MAG: DUF4982 domain-containing protein [Bacteroidales bacterium]|nr:DUF4982 domain-containing protein [Bacteroidales bacterium]